SVKSIAFADLDREIDATRKILQRLPEQQLNWKAHEKSMSLGRLAMHVATLFQWMLDTIERDHLDMATAPPPRQEPSGREDLLKTFETNAAAVKAALAEIDDASLLQIWTLRNGDQVIVA